MPDGTCSRGEVVAGPSLSIRPADHSDLEALAAFSVATYVAAFGHSFRPSDLVAHLATSLSEARWRSYFDEDRILVAIEAGAIRGFVQFGATGDPGVMELRRLYVDPKRFGEGVGSRLLQAALADPILSDAACLELDVWEDNPGAARLYRRFGFVPAGRRAFRSPSGEVTGYDIIMRRYAERPRGC